MFARTCSRNAFQPTILLYEVDNDSRIGGRFGIFPEKRKNKVIGVNTNTEQELRMKVLKEESETAQKIREVEQYLRDQKVSICSRGDGLLITVDGLTFVIVDGESKDIQQSFPTYAEPSQIQTISDYIDGS